MQLPTQVRPGESTTTIPMVLLMPQFKLPAFGEFQIDLAVDGRIEASIPLYVRQVQAQGHGAQPQPE